MSVSIKARDDHGAEYDITINKTGPDMATASFGGQTFALNKIRASKDGRTLTCKASVSFVHPTIRLELLSPSGTSALIRVTVTDTFIGSGVYNYRVSAGDEQKVATYIVDSKFTALA